MNIQRFTAATSREALAKARLAFGEGTLILSNRPTEHGVEVVATAEDSLAALSGASPSRSVRKTSSCLRLSAASHAAASKASASPSRKRRCPKFTLGRVRCQRKCS